MPGSSTGMNMDGEKKEKITERLYPRHCEASEAIHLGRIKKKNGFARRYILLAMDGSGATVEPPQPNRTVISEALAASSFGEPRRDAGLYQ